MDVIFQVFTNCKHQNLENTRKILSFKRKKELKYFSKL